MDLHSATHSAAREPASADRAPPDRGRVAVIALCALLAGLGLLSRVAPMLDAGGRLFRQWATEDGYLMLTIARNIAVGHGMTIAEGTIPTNGTQPLMTFAYAACFWVSGGDRWWGVLLAHALSITIAAAAAWMLYRLARNLLAGRPGGDLTAAVTACLWFASPIVTAHSMNMLETGAYAAMVLACVLAFVAPSRQADGHWPLIRCVGFGVLLGLTFLTRIDAVFLIAAICAVRVAPALRTPSLITRRVTETFIFGITSVIVAVPWLYYSHSRFGSLMPISGQAEGVEVRFGQNIAMVPAKLAEYLMIVVPIPASLEKRPVVVSAAAAIVAVALVMSLVTIMRSRSSTVRSVIAIVWLFALGLCGYYGLFFGAGWFLGRYLMPLSPFAALLSVSSFVWLAERVPAARVPRALIAAAAVALLLSTAEHLRRYRKGTNQGHFQVVDWVTANVPRDAWMAAVQTGTLGFFHDRTINLDGKVNPEALQLLIEALRTGGHRRVDEYIVSKRVSYMADWANPMADYSKHGILDHHFEVLVMERPSAADPYGLGVLRRVTPLNAPLEPSGGDR